MSEQTIEIVLFRLAPNVTTAEFLEAAQGIESWLEEVGGFQRRELSHNAEGQWVDIVYWDSLEQAQSAAETIMATEAGQAFGSKIDGESIQMMHVHPTHKLSAV